MNITMFYTQPTQQCLKTNYSGLAMPWLSLKLLNHSTRVFFFNTFSLLCDGVMVHSMVRETVSSVEDWKYKVKAKPKNKCPC